MCFGCALVAGVVVVSSQIVPIDIQPALLRGEVAVVSKTLAAFPGTSQALSSNQRSAIKSFVQANTAAESLVCVGTSWTRDSAAVKSRNKARAKAACDYAKRVDFRLRTSVVAQTSGTRGASGRVTLQLKQLPTQTPPAPDVTPPQANDPFSKPFPTVFTTQELVDSALAAVKRHMQTSSKSKVAKVVYEDTIPSSERTWISKLIETTMASLPFVEGQVPIVVVGSTDAFINQSLSQNGTPGYSASWWCGSETTYERYCAGAGWAAMNYKDAIEKKLPITDSGKRAVVAHEIYHVWHKSVDGSPGNNNRDPQSPGATPLWFIEGMANFMGFAIAHHDGATTYASGRASQIVPYMRSSSKPLSEHIGWNVSPYGIGQAASEYLIASIGVEKVFDIYRKAGLGKDFAVAFEESAGISLNEFYSRFEASRSNF